MSPWSLTQGQFIKGGLELGGVTITKRLGFCYAYKESADRVNVMGWAIGALFITCTMP